MDGFVFLIVSVFAYAVTFFGAVSIITVIWAFFVSLKAFFTALRDNKDPYARYVDPNPNTVHGVRRGYFFGPGLNQMKLICRDSESNLKHAGNVFKPTKYSDGLLDYFLWIAANISISFFGSVWLAIFCAVLSVILAVGAVAFYVCFSLLWAADRLVLFMKSIQSRCPNCKRVSIIPIFACPECGRRHNHLTPGPYGIFQMKCACGNYLPLTAFNGRSKLKAYCPYCNEPLASAGASQFGIQIAGSISSGKTTYLSAFWDSYKKMLKSSPDIVSFLCRLKTHSRSLKDGMHSE